MGTKVTLSEDELNKMYAENEDLLAFSKRVQKALESPAAFPGFLVAEMASRLKAIQEETDTMLLEKMGVACYGWMEEEYLQAQSRANAEAFADDMREGEADENWFDRRWKRCS